MSAGLLTPATAGFFGKLPTTGDFVSRGLPALFQRRWDGWVTRYLAPRLWNGAEWPLGGVRFRLVSGSRVAAGVVLPGKDAAGRQFPFSAILIGHTLPAPSALDPWCDACMAGYTAALGADISADALWDLLDGIAAPAGNGVATDLLLWSVDTPPISADPENPAPALDQIFSRSLSSG